jgi:hypothetical protein
MADVIIIINLIVSACSVVLIPVIIKSLDILQLCTTRIKHSECCFSVIDMEKEEKKEEKEKTKLII